MRRLIADIYKIVYAISGIKIVALSVAVGYISALNMMCLYGLCMLMHQWLPVEYILEYYTFPRIIILAIVIIALDILIMIPFKNLDREKGTRIMAWPIIIYTILSLLAFFFSIFNHMESYDY